LKVIQIDKHAAIYMFMPGVEFATVGHCIVSTPIALSLSSPFKDEKEIYERNKKRENKRKRERERERD
jgi:hypothetical protein